MFIDTDPKFEKHCGTINEFENNHENLEKEHCDEEMEESQNEDFNGPKESNFENEKAASVHS